MATNSATMFATHQLVMSPEYIRGETDQGHVERMRDAFINAGDGKVGKWPSTMPPADVAPLLEKVEGHAKLIKQGYLYEILDGTHRYLGSREAGMREIPCIPHDIPPMDRIEFQVKANAGHSVLPFSIKARNTAIRYFAKVKKWGDDKIAGLMKMHRSTVSRIRREVSGQVAEGVKPKKPAKKTGSAEFGKWVEAGLKFVEKNTTAIKGFLAKTPEGASQLQTLTEGLEAFTE